MNQSADLLVGDAGEAVRDLQARLGAVGFEVPSDELGRFGECTLSAVRAFQRSRGLLADGTCGRQTWSALVESGFALGDRMLYVRQPMLRGDDVAALQRGLNRLGFDAGREDGIFGPDTATASTEFQRNAGLAPDAIFGSATLAALSRLGTLAAGSVAAVREREMLRRGPHGLDGRRVYVMAAPGFEALGDAVARGLLGRGADTLLDASGDEASLVAAAANQFEAELFLALERVTQPAVGAATSRRQASAPKPASASPARYRKNFPVFSDVVVSPAGVPTQCYGRPEWPPLRASLPSRVTSPPRASSSRAG